MSHSKETPATAQINITTRCLTEVAEVNTDGTITVWHDQTKVNVFGCAPGLPLMKTGDQVTIDLLSNGQAIIQSVISHPTDSRFLCEYTVRDGMAQLALPESIEQFEISLGNATLNIGRDGTIDLNGDTIIIEAEGVNQLSGQPLKLNS